MDSQKNTEDMEQTLLQGEDYNNFTIRENTPKPINNNSLNIPLSSHDVTDAFSVKKRELSEMDLMVNSLQK